MNEAKLYENEKKLEEKYSKNNEYAKQQIMNDDENIPDSRHNFENKNDMLLNQVLNNNNYKMNNKLVLFEEHPGGNRPISPHYGNIGRNIVICNKYVLGIKSSLSLFILTFIGMMLTFFGWIIFNNYFYSIYIYIIGGIPYCITQYFFILCFLTEPGIIPRNDPLFSEVNNKNNDKLKKNDENDNNSNDNIIKKKENEDIQIQIKEEKKNEEDNESHKTTIPNIFTERMCSTCGIIRPPRASHCRHCDNCILNLDHHCFYISNCVGERNHKYFYLFLFFGSITSIYLLIMNIIVIIYVFIINSKKLWTILFSNDKWILILSIILIGISVVYASLGSYNIYVLFGPSGLGLILFIFIFYKNRPNDYEFFRNPFNIIITVSCIQLGAFVIINLIKQTKSIGSGLTIKQNNSIQKEILHNSLNNKKTEFDKNLLAKKSKKEQFNNIIKFLKKKIEKSLIIPSRDLFDNKK